MKIEEKILISNLFKRFKEIEEKKIIKDIEAENLIQKLMKQQTFSSYYMVQSILIQEAALNKLNKEIQILKNKNKENKKKSSIEFLKNFFLNKKNENNIKKSYSLNNDINQTTKTTNNSSFMSNALQTAAGVAGGVMLGNMLINMFKDDTTKDIINIIDNNDSSYIKDNDLINEENIYENTEENIDENIEENIDENNLLSNENENENFEEDNFM